MDATRDRQLSNRIIDNQLELYRAYKDGDVVRYYELEREMHELMQLVNARHEQSRH